MWYYILAAFVMGLVAGSLVADYGYRWLHKAVRDLEREIQADKLEEARELHRAEALRLIRENTVEAERNSR